MSSEVKEEVKEYALNILKRRIEEQQTKNAPKLTHLAQFSKMIQNASPSVSWTPQALREFYVELEDLLSMLKSHKVQEIDEAIITIFGLYSSILKNIRKSVESNATSRATITRIVEDVLPPRVSTYPHQSFIWRILGYTYDVVNYSKSSAFAKGVDYFVNLVTKEAVFIVEQEERNRVNKYDVILALERVKKASMKSFIEAKKTNAVVTTPLPTNVAQAVVHPENPEIPMMNKNVVENTWKNQAHALENELEKCRRKVKYYRNKSKKI